MAFYKQQSLQFCLTSGSGAKEKGFYCVSPGCGEDAGQMQQMVVKQIAGPADLSNRKSTRKI